MDRGVGAEKEGGPENSADDGPWAKREGHPSAKNYIETLTDDGPWAKREGHLSPKIKLIV
jgi:hypothetical protein